MPSLPFRAFIVFVFRIGLIQKFQHVPKKMGAFSSLHFNIPGLRAQLPFQGQAKRAVHTELYCIPENTDIFVLGICPAFYPVYVVCLFNIPIT